MDPTTVGISGVLLVPLIIGLVQFVKRLDTGNVIAGNVWLASSMLLGVGGYATVHIATVGVPTDFLGWAGLVVLGLSFGLASSKAYDETMK